MAICKCKMCGGNLNVTELDKVAECEYCGTTQTVPGADNEKKMALFNRANRLRLNSEFDKAAGLYESIIADFPEEAEAYWGVLLCKYGIEYVTDPATGKKIPTCHRSSFDSVMEDESFDQACEYADPVARRLYREEAKRIEEIRKGIIEVSSKEAPYDIFICYKETDEDGSRTEDSVMAQDVYTLLVEKGYRVFFARVSLAQKLGQEYEPYIFAALNSAKIMLVFGTDYEYMNAAWVKNEWSRFLQLIAAGQKKTLIPCFKNMDAYDMPKEFQKLQGVDLSSVGASHYLLQSIDTIIPRGGAATPVQPAANPAAATVNSLLKRAFMFLEDENWQSADEYAEKVLDIDPENGEAYLAKAMAELKATNRSALSEEPEFETNANTAKALRFGSENLLTEIRGYIEEYHQQELLQREEEAKRIAAENEEKERLLKEKEEADRKAKEAAIVTCAKQRRYVSAARGLLSAGEYHTVGVKTDGTVAVTQFLGDSKYGENRGQCDVSAMTDIIAVAAGCGHTVGLKRDGTVIAVGNNNAGQCNVSDWTDIFAICVGTIHTVGLKRDGSVVAVGDDEHNQCMVSEWKDVVAVDAYGFRTIGLKRDGSLVCTPVGEDDIDNGQNNVSDFQDIVAIAIGWEHTIGLKKDGTVIAVGNNSVGQCNVSDWNSIIAISAGSFSSIGLKCDGTVVATGMNLAGQCNVENWHGIIAIDAHYTHTVGLKKDGTVVAAGNNYHGQCNVSKWKLFENYETLHKEREIASKRAEEQRKARIEELSKAKAVLEAELPNLTGFFKAGKRKEAEARIAEIEADLKKLQE